MPVLTTQDHELYTSIETINKIIYPNWVGKFDVTQEMIGLAENRIINDELKQKIILTLPDVLIENYQKMNLLYPSMFIARLEIKNELDKKLREYEKVHVNNCDEIHHVVNGSVHFGFVNADGKQAEIFLLAGEKIFIKENSEHWGTVTNDYYATLITYRTVAAGNLVVKQTGTKISIKK